jgi:DNA-binding NtrC family response regulator
MGQAQQKSRAVLIVEDDVELRSLTAALFQDEELETIECESAEAALAALLIGGRVLVVAEQALALSARSVTLEPQTLARRVLPPE